VRAVSSASIWGTDFNNATMGFGIDFRLAFYGTKCCSFNVEFFPFHFYIVMAEIAFYPLGHFAIKFLWTFHHHVVDDRVFCKAKKNNYREKIIGVCYWHFVDFMRRNVSILLSVVIK
jgi:hypothetical protein